MRAVLLIPAPEHADALLRGGAHGARVPTHRMFVCVHHGTQPETDPPIDAFCPRCHEERRQDAAGSRGLNALVLAWDGAVCDEGCDRAARCCNATPKPGQGSWRNFNLLDRYTVEQALEIAHECAARGLGTVVLGDTP